MRIISQGGMVSFPFDDCSVSVCGGIIIVEWNDRKPTQIAEYPTHEMAMKAFEKMHRAYENSLFAVFRFPTEEEMNKPQNNMEWNDFDMPWQTVKGDDEMRSGSELLDGDDEE